MTKLKAGNTWPVTLSCHLGALSGGCLGKKCLGDLFGENFLEEICPENVSGIDQGGKYPRNMSGAAVWLLVNTQTRTQPQTELLTSYIITSVSWANKQLERFTSRSC